MKTINKFIAILMVTTALGLHYSCTKNGSSGTPIIDYVRINRPLSADSLLVAATQGSNIVIVGDNLGNTVQCWFNNQQASLTPPYITNTNIMVQVPTNVPTVINNKIKLVFSNGDSLLYNFQVSINKPTLNSMDCEYVNDGSVATIRGNYFYAPFKVYFPGVSGPMAAVIDSFGDEVIKVTVPVGSQPGQITVTSNFGTTSSNFLFRDNRNIFISSDPFVGWHDPSFVVTNPGPTDPPSIAGNYIRVNQLVTSWEYLEVADGPSSSYPIFANFPADAILHPSLYYLKFEVNTVSPYTANCVNILAGAQDNSHGFYQWQPPYNTNGQWQTVVIPYDQVVSSYSNAMPNPPGGYFTGIIFQGATALAYDICFDSFRIVPRTIPGNN